MYFTNSENKVSTKAYIDGYQFGDTLLDGVYFVCEIIEDKVKVTGVNQSSLAYFSKLNSAMWMEKAQKFAEQNDIFSGYDEETGGVDNDDWWLTE